MFDTWMDSSCSNLFVSRYRSDATFFNANFPVSLRPQGREMAATGRRLSTSPCRWEAFALRPSSG